MTDQSNYRSTNQAAWVNVQLFPNEKLELYANTMWNAGQATIYGYTNDSSTLLAQPAGLNFALMSDTFAGFSDIELGHLVQTVGLNYRLRQNVVFNAALEYNDYKDNEPYLYDTTGRRLGFYTGVNWIF